MGIPVLHKLKAKNIDRIVDWVTSDFKIEISYPEVTEKIVNMIFESHVQSILKKNKWDKKYNLLIPLSRKDKKNDPKKSFKNYKNKTGKSLRPN